MCSSLSAKWPAQKNWLPVSTFLDEYTDWERRKCNLVIHNLPESTEEILADRNISDTQAVLRIVDTGLNIEGIEITKVISLGGEKQVK